MANTNVLLIVEDDPSMARLYNDAFSLSGYEVKSAMNGEDGLKKAQELKPAVILLDIMMPKMDGIRVLEHLKADKRTRDIPVIMLTNIARDTLGAAEEAMKKGAEKYIVKSDHEPDAIVKLIDEVLSK